MIDVYLFSGFLGSGKTTVLLNVIQQLKKLNQKPAVFMNEFGELPIDSNTIENDVPLKEILDGCICCSGAEKTEAQLQALLIEHPHVDVILIETTGAAHPVEALDAVHSPLFANDLQVKGIITVVDSQLLQQRSHLSPQIRSLFLEQIRHAHILLANKSDLLSPEEQAKVTFELSQLNPHAPIIQTVKGDISFTDIENLLNHQQQPKDKKVLSAGNLPLASKVITFSSAVKMDEFEHWVRNLPETVYRIKGFVPIVGTKNPYLFQYAYGMVQWMPEYIQMQPQIVLIGENIDDIEYH